MLKSFPSSFRASYAARVDVALVEHSLRGKLDLYRRICSDFVGVETDKGSVDAFEKWDGIRSTAAARAATIGAKAKRATKRARKSQLLGRRALKSGAYTYITSDERTAKNEHGDDSRSDSDADSDVESDAGAEDSAATDTDSDI